MTHRIVSVTYEPGTNDGPLDCSCGWSGRAVDHDLHRTGRHVDALCPRGHCDWDRTPRGRRCRPCHREATRRYNATKRARRKARAAVAA